jgi:hypothetical protein
MSQATVCARACPACGHEEAGQRFTSLNADLLPARRQEILRGEFAQVRCAACGHGWQEEHELLYVELSTGAWILMEPPSRRARFATWERGIALLLARHFEGAPEALRASLAQVRPRLVFGQAGLTEALRLQEAGLDAATVECLKLMIIQRELPSFLAKGPAQLLFEAVEGGQRLRFALARLPDGAPLGALGAPLEALREVEARREALSQTWPALFTQPYVSATRYLFGATL